ncbi:MAG: hypothetical protein JNL39_15865 [Opitutaceae bacterium]|nr:hypothetical protein [Opitutaceae bacterium]
MYLSFKIAIMARALQGKQVVPEFYLTIMKFSLTSSVKLAAVVLGLWSSSASAATIPASWTSPTPPNNYFNVNSLGQGTLFGGNITLPYYKVDFPATESGPGASAIAFTFSPDGMSALFTWTPMGSQAFTQIALKQANGYILWDTSGVNWGVYNGFYVTNDQSLISQPGISHITMAGGSQTPPPPTTGVPDDGSTFALMGSVLVLLAFSRRKLV